MTTAQRNVIDSIMRANTFSAPWSCGLQTSTVDLHDLDRAEVDGDVTAGSLRVAGVGGLFVYAGWFWNKELGRYRLYATDRELAVVLYFRDHRPVVVTPHDPEGFVSAIQATKA